MHCPPVDRASPKNTPQSAPLASPSESGNTFRINLRCLRNNLLIPTCDSPAPQPSPFQGEGAHRVCRANIASSMTAGSILGLVLAGGLARRMGGGDKARIMIGGKTILQRVLARLAPQCSALILNANGDPARFADTRLPVIADDVPGFAGALAGILAGLDFA